MASIDERVVNMSFRGAGFLAMANSIVQALEKLKLGLSSLKGSGKALDDIGAAGKKVDLSGISKGIDDVASKFGFLRVAAEAAFATIATRAVMAATALISKFTFAPIMAGLHEYETEMNAIQVITANTGLKGEAGMKQIQSALDELNTYADKTIYSFEDMTSAISKFTAAGVGLKDSVAAIKGLANVAAISGAGTQQLAHAQYQLSQALASGTIRLQDWMSIEQADMGGKAFRESLMMTAKVHGVNVDQMIKKNGSFRLSLQEGWLTSDIMIETLKTLTGDLSAEQLKSMGYTDQQIKKVQELAKAAVDAATKIRTPTQVISTVAEAVQSAWARVWKAIFGNLDQATALFTGIANALSKVFVAPINHLGNLLSLWSQLGGRAVLINAISDAFKILGSVLKPIGQAFRDVFPASTASSLAIATVRLHDFINSLKPSEAVLRNLHSIFEGLFSAIKIGFDIFKGIISVIGQVLKSATGLGGGILGLAAKFGTFLSNLRKTIESGDGLTNFFRNLGTILSAPVKVLSALGSVLASIGMAAGKALSALQPFFAKVVDGFAKLGDAIANAIRSGDISSVMTILNQGIFAAILLAVRKFVSNFGKSMTGGFGLVDKIKSIFGGLTDTMKALQTNLNAGTLQKIAIAIGILTASVVALSLIDAGKLTKSLTAITVMFGQLAGAMAVLQKISPMGIAQMFALGVAMNLLAGAILILSGAVALLAQLSWSEIAKGISAVAAMMVILVGAVKLLSKNTPGVLAASAAMILMAIALNIMAGAVALLGNMNWSTIFKGVGTIAALLGLMALFNAFGGIQLIGTATAMLVLAAALNVFALAMKQLGSLSWGEIGKGLTTVAAGLVIMAFGMSLMPMNMLATAAGLLVVSAALLILSKALNAMGGMSWEGIAKSLVVLAASLVLIAGAMMLMTGALPGAAALLIVAAALTMLVPPLIALGSLSWSTLLTGLAALAGIFLVLGVAGLLLGPLAPIILALAAAILIFGAGVLAIGAGVALLGAGLVALGGALAVSGSAILTFVTGILNLIPLALQKIGEGIVQLAGAIAKGGAAITGAFVTILSSLLSAIIKVMPQIGQALQAILTMIINLIVKNAGPAANAMGTLIMAVLNAIASRMGQFVQKGSDIIVSFLNGIARNMGRVITAGVTAVVSFINGVAANLGRIVNAGIDLALKFVNSVANGLRTHTGEIQSAGYNIGSALIQGAISGIVGLAGGIISAAVNAVKGGISAMWNAIKGGSPSRETMLVGASMMQGLAIGLEKETPLLLSSAEKITALLLRALSDMDPDLQPTITPVIDLTQAKKGFDDLAAMARSQQLVPSVSATTAASISVPSVPSETEKGMVVAGGTYLNFTQNNTSPKALSSAEIYRQTKNQLSTMKGALPA